MSKHYRDEGRLPKKGYSFLFSLVAFFLLSIAGWAVMTLIEAR